MVIVKKWQNKEKSYHGALSGYGDKILLVRINYDPDGKDKKHHTCIIEEYGNETIQQQNILA